jgi:enterochelin esterase-like enzyme
MWPAFGKDTIGWAARDPARLAATALARKATLPRVLIDCGVDDPFLDQNRDLHVALQRLGVSHEYAEWPGAHSWDYWRAHVPQSLDFLLRAVSTP